VKLYELKVTQQSEGMWQSRRNQDISHIQLLFFDLDPGGNYKPENSDMIKKLLSESLFLCSPLYLGNLAIRANTPQLCGSWMIPICFSLAFYLQCLFHCFTIYPGRCQPDRCHSQVCHLRSYRAWFVPNGAIVVILIRLRFFNALPYCPSVALPDKRALHRA
jgi:hypothetical protein